LQSLQDEEHVLFDCRSVDLAELRIKRHHLFRTFHEAQAGLETLLAKQTLKDWLSLCMSACIAVPRTPPCLLFELVLVAAGLGFS